jgi:hypothetical protein
MYLQYNFGGPNQEVSYDFYISNMLALKVLLDDGVITREVFEEASYNDADAVLNDNEEYLLDYYEEEAREEYNDREQERKNPYSYRGVSPKDFE